MQIRMFAEEADLRHRRDLFMTGVAMRCAAATEAGWKQFQNEFKTD